MNPKRWKPNGMPPGSTENVSKPILRPRRTAYSIVIPPPNVTGILHLGHVLNNALQDILARRARQEGKEVLWLPGTDHAGIATQAKVERELREKEGKTRRDLGRDEFLKRVWDFKDHHGGIIIKQLKRLGCSCDWGRERFTMDEAYTEVGQPRVRRAFQARPDLPRQADGQLVPGFPHRALRRGGDHDAAALEAVFHEIRARRRARRVSGNLHHPSGNA